MSEPLQFFKVDHKTIYQDGFSYSFYRDLDPPKSSADLQLRQSFHCAFGTEEQKCPSRCHVTGDWQMDKKGSKFMLGIVKKADHTHGPEYRDTIPKFKFYKNDDESLHRNGFVYSLYRELDPPKQIADLEWLQTYHCSLSVNGQENCRARIYTTGQWETNKREMQYQLGIFKNCFHNHGSEQDSNEENNNGNIEQSNNNEKNIAVPASSFTRTKDLDTIPKFRFYKNDDESLHRNGFVYSLYRKLDSDHGSDQNLNEESKEIVSPVISPLIMDIDKKERIRFYRHKTASVQHGGFVYNFNKALEIPEWMHQMYCNRQVKGKHTCTAYIWTTGKWEEDDRGREFQIGIDISEHNHEPHKIAFQGEDDDDDETPAAGLKFYKYNEKVHRDGHMYCFDSKLKSRPPWKQRMRCTRTINIGDNKRVRCNGAIWTTGEWEVDSYATLYQRGITRGPHSHKAYEQSLDEDDEVICYVSRMDYKAHFNLRFPAPENGDGGRHIISTPPSPETVAVLRHRKTATL
ncbi:hypothetical protein DdX_13736 [Ditylenchus destructor]|uniref:Uncharacterized protein n=1 Tax=Ditylenchus destructor TaxID=166010 RepID=A0AAD4QWA1_9BILA|nr:hypothetical protein DdX_13736 [Ditylenchus destructor]